MKQLIPASDWFFIGSNYDKKMKTIIPLIAWALNDEGNIVGLIPVPHLPLRPNKNIPLSIQVSHVISPAPVGIYKHLQQLTEKEKIAAFSNDNSLSYDFTQEP